MHPDSKLYFAAIGQQLIQLRRQHGNSQGDAANAAGVTPQAMFAYEKGERRVSILILVKLANFYHKAFEELALLDRSPPTPRGRLSPRALHNAERLLTLSKTQRRFVTQIIEALEKRNATH